MSIEETSENLTLRTFSNRKTSPSISKIALMGILTAVETVTTAMIQIPIPATSGYFNIGDGIIYFVALLFGPNIGFFVGGVGAALSDLITGYAIYAPATFIGKGLEGFVCGWIFFKLKKSQFLDKNWQLFVALLGIGIGVIMIVVDYVVTSGDLLSGWVLLLITLILVGTIFIIGFWFQKEVAQKIIAITPGGVIMVAGYFLYESYIIRVGVPAAMAEFPFNVLQVTIGILIALPLSTALQKFVQQLDFQQEEASDTKFHVQPLTAGVFGLLLTPVFYLLSYLSEQYPGTAVDPAFILYMIFLGIIFIMIILISLIGILTAIKTKTQQLSIILSVLALAILGILSYFFFVNIKTIFFS